MMEGSHGGRRPARCASEVAPRPGADWSRAGAAKPPKLREAAAAVAERRWTLVGSPGSSPTSSR